MSAKKKLKAPTVPDEVIILGCSYCLKSYDWNRTQQPEGFGYCFCRTANFLRSIGKDQKFLVLKEHRHEAAGHVIVQRGDGFWQRLRGPSWQEDPGEWKPGTVKPPKV